MRMQFTRAKKNVAPWSVAAFLAVAHCGPATMGDTTSMDAADTTVSPDVVDAPPPTDTRPTDGGGTLNWGACSASEEFFQCTTLSVPVNYDNPTGARIQLHLIRMVSRVPSAQRRGTMLVNPGGPGDDGILWFRGNNGLRAYLGAGATPYDILTWDVRGTGESTPAIECNTPAYNTLRNADLTPDDPMEQMTLQQAFVDIRAACARDNTRELLESVGVENVARDMEQIRIALGDERIHYYGRTSGTVLGATYATMFPQRVGAFILDANIDPSLDRARMVRESAAGQLDVIMQFFTWCAMQTDARCPYRRGDTTGAAIAARFLALWQRMEMTPVDVAGRPLTGSDLVIGAFDLAAAVRWIELGPAIAMLDQTTPDGNRLLMAADDAWGGRTPGTVSQTHARHAAMMALDFPYADGLTDMLLLDSLRMAVRPELPPLPTMPTFERLGLGWPIRAVRPRRAISAPMAPPILLLAVRTSSTTPASWAAGMSRALGNMTYTVTYEGVGQSALAGGTSCVRDQVAAYLNNPMQAPPMNSCPAVAP